ncbi:hypothetical protein JKG68_07575 [Microvirga aerilata]|uniref:Uncharacterized protein n=1 Tax=Microvirga aerilata TaxID=670292 RepID=A0A936Z664_9HYPH|nr:hypothetical protein [Microvirga aerilata]MBL0403818.1 hypothetical protein [Microvirga aerilata]
MIFQTLDKTSCTGAQTSFRGPSELQPLVQSLQSILKQVDDEYERERERLVRTLPDGRVKDRALAMLKSRHLERRGNYVRELAALQGT